MMYKRILVGVVAIAATLACTDQKAQDEAAVLETISGYLTALDTGDFSTAHSLLASSIQARLPHDQYVHAHESMTPPEVKKAPPTNITYGELSVSPYRALVPVSLSITDPGVVGMVRAMQSQSGTVVEGLEGEGNPAGDSIEMDVEYELVKEDGGWRVVLNEGAVALEEQAIANAN